MRRYFYFIISFFSLGLFADSTKLAGPKPPIARKSPYKTEIHGHTLIDQYHWLRDKSQPEVRRYLEAENAYTEAVMAPTKALQETLYNELVGRIKETDIEVPYQKGDYFYYTRTEAGKQYNIYCRKKGSLTEKEEIILDLNELAKEKSFISISDFEISPNARYLAYTYDDIGFRQYKLVIKDLTTGLTLIDTADRVGSVVWANDNETLFYTQEDEQSKRQFQAYRHKINTKGSDILVYEEQDERFSVSLTNAADQSYIFLLSASLTATEARCLDANTPLSDFLLMQPRQPKIEYYPDHSGPFFYLRINDKGENFRLVKMQLPNQHPKDWTEVIPHKPSTMLDNVDFFQSFMVLDERQNGLPTLTVLDYAQAATPIVFSEASYNAYPYINREYNAKVFLYAYQSPITPYSVFSFNTKDKRSTLVKQKEIPNYDKNKYRVERLFAKAQDGTSIPITIVTLKNQPDQNNRALYLYAYGSYGYPIDASFNSNAFSLVDRGVNFAIAHIRGGGELGKAWHEAGRMMQKKNTFTDFIACAEYLVASGYGTASRLVIEGRSAGGLLMGAVTNMRPDLFKAVILGVPFVDVINTMLDKTLPLTVGEFEEWGNPEESKAFGYMLSYSPYDNIVAKAYPNMLIKTSLHDSQVMYWEPAKYTAKMRATKTSDNIVLLKTNLEPSGHGGKSGRYDKLKETAFDYAFILTQLGISN